MKTDGTAPVIGRKKGWSGITFRTRIIILFVLALYGTVGALGFFVFNGWFREVDRAVSQTAAWHADEVTDRLDAFLDIPRHLVDVNHDLVGAGVVNLGDARERDRFFASVLRTHMGSSVLSFTLGLNTGEYYGVRWNPEAKMELVRNNASTGGHSWYYSSNADDTAGEMIMDAGAFDPRTRDWYREAQKTVDTVFSPIYSHFISRDLAISAGRAVSPGDTAWSGVLAAHVTLGQINEQLLEATQATGAQTVILERESGFLVANSLNISNFLVDGETQLARRLLSDEVHPGFSEAYRVYLSEGAVSRRMRDESGLNLVLATPYRRNGIDWLILTAVPESAFTQTPFLRFWVSTFVALLLLLGASFFFINMANRYLRPVRELINASAEFSSGNLARRAPISRNDEIGEMANAFNRMADTISAQVGTLENQVAARTKEWEIANQTLEESEDRLRLILDSTAEAIYGLDQQGNCTFCNTSCLRILGYPSVEALLGKNMHEAIHHSRRDGTPIPKEDCPILQAIGEAEWLHMPGDIFWRADGTALEVSYHAYPQLRNGERVGAVVSFMDITESRQAQERIQYLGTHDALTGLYNRPAFDEAMRRAEREEWMPVSILFGDVNGLKLTNDIFGHEAGDELLRTSAEILTRICREEDTIARVGGDEFTVLLPYTGAQGALQLRDRILEAFSEKTVSSIRCSISIGVATRADDHIGLEEVLKQAEEEMYKAKALERKRNDDSLIGTLMDTFFSRAPLEKAHAEAIGRIGTRIGQALGLPEPALRRLRETARLHDIGKIVLDEAELKHSELWLPEEDQLRKQGQPVEGGRNPVLEAMQRHVLVGYRILNLSSDTLDLAENVLAHHEHWDGSGYPKGLKGEESPLVSRILLLAEYYDDLINGNGRDTMKADAVAAFFRGESGIKFDPALVRVLLSLMKEGEL